jgi:hypothetical protein
MKSEDVAAAALAALHHDHQTTIPAVINENTAEADITARKIVGTTDKISKNSKTTITNSAEPPASSSGMIAKSTRGRKKAENFNFPAKPRVIQVVKKQRIYMQHSYKRLLSLDDNTFADLTLAVMRRAASEKPRDTVCVAMVRFLLLLLLLPAMDDGRPIRVIICIRTETRRSMHGF